MSIDDRSQEVSQESQEEREERIAESAMIERVAIEEREPYQVSLPITYECAICGEDFEEDSGGEIEYHHSIKWLCQECQEELVRCERCNSFEDSSDCESIYMRDWRRRTEEWCEDCREDYSSTCHHCGDAYENDCISEVFGESYCGRCRDDLFYTCDNCGDWIWQEDSFSNDNGVYCETCFDEEESSTLIHSYHSIDVRRELGFIPPNLPQKRTLYYGVELETQSTRGQIDTLAERTLDLLGRDFVILMEDSSIGYGFEIISAPSTLKVHLQKWENFLSHIPRGMTSWASGSCGIHIHVSRKPLTPLTIGKLVVFVNEPQNKTLINTIAGRYATSYCKIKPKVISSPANDNYDRYEAINLTNSQTIEFRIFRGTLNKVHFFANLEFVDSLIHFCKDSSMRGLAQDRYLERLKSERRIYPHLAEYLTIKSLIPPLPKDKRVEKSSNQSSFVSQEV